MELSVWAQERGLRHDICTYVHTYVNYSAMRTKHDRALSILLHTPFPPSFSLSPFLVPRTTSEEKGKQFAFFVLCAVGSIVRAVFPLHVYFPSLSEVLIVCYVVHSTSVQQWMWVFRGIRLCFTLLIDETPSLPPRIFDLTERKYPRNVQCLNEFCLQVTHAMFKAQPSILGVQMYTGYALGTWV